MSNDPETDTHITSCQGIRSSANILIRTQLLSMTTRAHTMTNVAEGGYVKSCAAIRPRMHDEQENEGCEDADDGSFTLSSE